MVSNSIEFDSQRYVDCFLWKTYFVLDSRFTTVVTGWECIIQKENCSATLLRRLLETEPGLVFLYLCYETFVVTLWGNFHNFGIVVLE
jgi:hypothetical protein